MPSTDPITLVEAALFSLITSSEAVTALVRVGNRHSPQSPRPKASPAAADLPELRLAPHSAAYDLQVSSRSSRITLAFSLTLATSSMSTSSNAGINAIKWAAIAALAAGPAALGIDGVTSLRVIDSVDAAYQPGARATRAAEPANRLASRSAWRHDLRRVAGRQSLLRIEIELWLDTSMLIDAAH